MGKQIHCLNYTIATQLLYHVHVCCNNAMDVNHLISFHLVIKDFTITEKARFRAFSWLKAPTSALTFKTLLRHYAKRALTPRLVDVKLHQGSNVQLRRLIICSSNPDIALQRTRGHVLLCLCHCVSFSHQFQKSVVGRIEDLIQSAGDNEQITAVLKRRGAVCDCSRASGHYAFK